jgi:hypothetical protein
LPSEHADVSSSGKKYNAIIGFADKNQTCNSHKVISKYSLTTIG